LKSTCHKETGHAPVFSVCPEPGKRRVSAINHEKPAKTWRNHAAYEHRQTHSNKAERRSQRRWHGGILLAKDPAMTVARAL
jgi:hypothetical protein